LPRPLERDRNASGRIAGTSASQPMLEGTGESPTAREWLPDPPAICSPALGEAFERDVPLALQGLHTLDWGLFAWTISRPFPVAGYIGAVLERAPRGRRAPVVGARRRAPSITGTAVRGADRDPTPPRVQQL
jgi:hypothetical protein